MAKISVKDFIDNNELLEITYTPFDQKMEIVSKVLTETIKAIGGLNTSLLRRISTEVFIESITNIDMNVKDDNGLTGFDQLNYTNELDTLLAYMGNEYIEFTRILNERVADYIRIETNPSVTINAIYDNVKTQLNTVLDMLGDYIQNIDMEQLADTVSNIVDKAGVVNEG